MTAGQMLRERRRRLGITQAELARRTGLDERTIRRAEKGRRVDQRSLMYIATVFKRLEGDSRDLDVILEGMVDREVETVPCGRIERIRGLLAHVVDIDS